MKTFKVDGQKRIRLPDLKPGQIFAYENANGTVTLRPVKVDEREAFPRGSLLKYITPEWNKEALEILKGCAHGPGKDEPNE